MGHLVNPDRTYQLLQKRLDRNPTGAPDSPAFQRILRLLFRPGEADVARRLPTRFVPIDVLAGRLDLRERDLAEMVTTMAARGLVFDIERKGRRYAALAPVVIGFFEFSFMRMPEDVPARELSELFETYFFEGDGAFSRAVFGGSVQIGRSIVREEALPQGDHAEVLDWERASKIVEQARTVGVSTCACRHHAEHLGTSCDRPQRACMTFDFGAETLIRSGHAERLTSSEGMKILESCKEAGLAQTADNVKSGIGYICNCCGCCCGMMRAIKSFGLSHAIVSSNWLMEIDESLCKGCGLCAKACPPGAISLADWTTPAGRPRKRATRAEELCLGCGVCAQACRNGAIRMVPREKRVFTPETTFDRIVAMAIERGKLADLLLEDDGLAWQAAGRVVKVLEALPPVKAALGVEPLRSAFLSAVLPLTRLGAAGTAKLMS